MLVKISSRGNNGDGVYIAVGRLIKDAELAFVGADRVAKTELTLYVGEYMDFANVILWRNMAKRFSSLKKGRTVFGLCIRETDEDNGKKYYTAEYIAAMEENAPVQDIPTTKQEEFVDISSEDIPLF